MPGLVTPQAPGPEVKSEDISNPPEAEEKSASGSMPGLVTPQAPGSVQESPEVLSKEDEPGWKYGCKGHEDRYDLSFCRRICESLHHPKKHWPKIKFQGRTGRPRKLREKMSMQIFSQKVKFLMRIRKISKAGENH